MAKGKLIMTVEVEYDIADAHNYPDEIKTDQDRVNCDAQWYNNDPYVFLENYGLEGKNVTTTVKGVVVLDKTTNGGKRIE